MMFVETFSGAEGAEGAACFCYPYYNSKEPGRQRRIGSSAEGKQLLNSYTP